MKSRGMIVQTKSGLTGKAPSGVKPINGKVVVKVLKDGKPVNLLCKPEDLKIIGYYD